MSTTLSIEHLTIGLPEGADRPFAVEDVSMAIEKGEILCVVGESGSGKSMTANALMGLLPPGVTVKAGRAMFEARDVLRLPETEKMALRGAEIAMIFQEPMTALNPLMRIGEREGLRLTVRYGALRACVVKVVVARRAEPAA